MKFLFIFSDVDAYTIEENENKYLIFALTENNIKVNSGESIKYKKDPMKIRLDSYDDLFLDKICLF